MLIMALDSSGVTATAAIATPEKIIAEYSVNNKLTHSQTLLPMLEEIRRMAGLEMKDVDAVALTGGPGSFTGLRIGSATAKGIALALQIPVISVPTLEAMAWNLIGREGLICPMMDARRKQVYTAVFEYADGGMKPVKVQDALAVEEMTAFLNETGRSVILLGDGADAYRSYLEENLTVPHFFAPPHLNAQRAGAVAVCAIGKFKAGQVCSAAQHRPEYLRVSQAERERSERERQEQADGAEGHENA